MRGFEVTDAERGRSVGQVEDAFARGRIGAADRELRLSRIREAETPDELTALTRDLALPTQDTDPRVAGSVPRAPRSAPALGPRTTSASTALGILVAGVAVVGAGVAAIVLFLGVSPDAPVTARGDDSVQAPPAVSVVTADGGLDAGRLRSVVRSYPDQFGTDETVQLAFSDGRVTATVPLAGDQPSAQMWEWDEGWRRLSGRAPVSRDVATVDLRTLDVRRLVRNVEVARTALGAEARVLRVVVADGGDGPRVRVELLGTNTAGTLVTTAGGTVVRGIRS